MEEQYYFRAMYEQFDDGSYRAWAPILPGCKASGLSVAEARTHIQEAIRCYCLNMQEHGARIPSSLPGQHATVDEIQIHLGSA